MYEAAKIKAYRPTKDGTDLIIFLPKQLQDVITEKRITSCGVWLEDGRHITAEQRKKAYATMDDISDWTGFTPEELKQKMKCLYIEKTGGEYFSFRNCSIDTAREFINVIMEFAIENGIPLSDLGSNRTDDIGKYLWCCLKYRKCAVCGQPGEIHHVDAIGIGRDRKTVDDTDYRKICLCRIHHSIAHQRGMDSFEKMYKVYGIKFKEE